MNEKPDFPFTQSETPFHEFAGQLAELIQQSPSEELIQQSPSEELIVPQTSESLTASPNHSSRSTSPINPLSQQQSHPIHKSRFQPQPQFSQPQFSQPRSKLTPKLAPKPPTATLLPPSLSIPLFQMNMTQHAAFAFPFNSEMNMIQLPQTGLTDPNANLTLCGNQVGSFPSINNFGVGTGSTESGIRVDPEASSKKRLSASALALMDPSNLDEDDFKRLVKRQKNNEAANKCRLKKKQNEIVTQEKARMLELENEQLKKELEKFKTETQTLREIITKLSSK